MTDTDKARLEYLEALKALEVMNIKRDREKQKLMEDAEDRIDNELEDKYGARLGELFDAVLVAKEKYDRASQGQSET